MFQYRIYLSLVNSSAPDFSQDMLELMLDAVEYYNARSRYSKNVKQITDFSLVNPREVRLTLNSTNELRSTPSQALRLFSQRLVEPFKPYVRHNQLFRMSCYPIEPKSSHEALVDQDINALQNKAIWQILLETSTANLLDIIDFIQQKHKEE